MTRQEQIEEMAKERNEIKDIMKLLDKCVSLNPMDKSEVASVLYGNNCRKIQEDSVMLSREEYEMLANKYKNLEIKYSHLCDNYRLCKDANETLKQNVINAGRQKVDRLEEENERLKEVNRQLNADYNRSLERLKSDCRQIDELNTEVKELKAELNARLTCNFVKTAQKQAQIEVLNRLKSLSIYDDNYLDGYVFIDDIEKLLEELTK